MQKENHSFILALPKCRLTWRSRVVQIERNAKRKPKYFCPQDEMKKTHS